jgi:hypothetical protein
MISSVPLLDSWYVGSEHTLYFRFKHPDGTNYNLTGHTLKLILARRTTDAAPLLTITGNISVAAEGLGWFKVTGAQTSTWMPRSYEATAIAYDGSTPRVTIHGRIGLQARNPEAV